MPQKIRIALDAMGGDVGADVVIPGAALALARHPDCEFLLFGDQARIAPQLEARAALKAAARVIHTDVAVDNHEKPSQALRRGRKTSSMWLAIEAVKKGEADVAISAGNTGALVAMARFCLRMLAGIDRPALAAIWPTLRGDCVVLDLGATIGGDARHLVALAAMGGAMASARLHVDRPKVGLLNIGTEEMKGTDELKEAAAILRDADYLGMRFDGFIEGDKLSRGDVDVVVTDGFSGNIALKSLEGTARFVTDLLRRAFQSSVRSKIGFLISRPATELLRHHLDPNNHNGAVFLGLNGLVVKSHGGATEKGVANAIRVAARMVREDLTRKIIEDLDNIAAHRSAAAAAAK